MMISAKKFLSSMAAVIVMSASYSFAADHKGVVLEVIPGGGYSYVNVEEKGEKFWIAGPPVEVKVGQMVSFSEQVWMPNFTSKALNRTFDKILFVSGIDAGSGMDSSGIHAEGSAEDAGMALPVSDAATQDEATDQSTDEAADDQEEAEPLPADGIFTVEQLYNRADELKGQTVKVRGKVVKVSEYIMGMNWVHIQDGTGKRGKNKVVFTSPNDISKVGETVLAEGTLETDKDFGYGYFYSVIVENGKFTEEGVEKTPEVKKKAVEKKTEVKKKAVEKKR